MTSIEAKTYCNVSHMTNCVSQKILKSESLVEINRPLSQSANCILIMYKYRKENIDKCSYFTYFFEVKAFI